MAPFQAHRTGDSYLVIAAGKDHLLELMAKAMGRPDLLANPSYATNALRLSNVDVLESKMKRTLRKRPTLAWQDVLNASGGREPDQAIRCAGTDGVPPGPRSGRGPQGHSRPDREVAKYPTGGNA
jgi:hypothetical protein